MDGDRSSELGRLRARAYGPEADIAGDLEAVERLRELEDLERPLPPPPPSGESPLVSARTEVGVAGDDAPAREDASAGENPVRERRPILRSRRRVWIAALGMAAALALTSGITAAGLSFTTVDRVAGIAQTDALTPDPDVELGTAGYLGFDPSQTRAYADYHGVTVFQGRSQIDSEGNDAACLLVVDTEALRDGDGGRAGTGARTGACGAGPFPASVEFIVTSTFPEAFRARYPVGTAVQFVLDGDDVGVFTAAG